MKKKIVFSIIILFFSLSGSLLRGQNVKIDGEIRSRIEYRDGFKRPLAYNMALTTLSTAPWNIGLHCRHKA